MRNKGLISAVFCLAMLALPLTASAEDGMAGDTVAGDAAAGEAMFNLVCVHCHKNDYDDKFGPGLKGIMDRVDEAWLDRWLADPAEMIKTDEHAKALHESNEYGMTMPSIPAMKDPQARANVIAYLKTLVDE